MSAGDDDAKIGLNVEPLGGGAGKSDTDSRMVVTESVKAEDTQQLQDLRVTARQGVGKKPPYDPDLLAQFIEKNETHSVAIRKKARYEVGYGFDLSTTTPDPEDASDTQRAVAEDFWFGRDSRWQTGPRQRAEPTVPEEVLELARQDFHAVGWCALEILTDTMGRPIGLAHVPANTIRVRTPQSEYDRVRHPETGSFADQDLGNYASRGYVQVRHGKRRYFGEAGDRYRGQEVTILGDPDADGTPEVRYIEDEGDDRDPIFVDKENGDVAVGGAEALDHEPANELIFMRNPSVLPDADAYGVPDWVSAIRTMVGDEAAKDYNRTFFENDTIPRFVIKVTGGTLSEESKRDLKKMLRNLRAEDHRAVIFEVDKFADGLQDDVEIELEPLGQGVTEEMSFAQYRERNEHLISQVHEVPPVVLGITETSNRSNSQAQVHEFATEVIEPEQNKFAERLYRLIHQRALGATDWSLDFILRGGNQPSVRADTARKKIQAVQGAIPVDRALEMIGEDPIGGERGEMLIADIGTDADPAIDALPGGETESAARPEYLPPEDNKVGEIDFEDVKTQLQVENGRATKDPIEQMEFDSSNLDEGLYDFETQDLFLSFRRGEGSNSLYVYTDVPTAEWQGLVNAASHGSYHHSNIRMSFGYYEITNHHDRLPEGPMPDELPESIPGEI